MLLTFCVTTYYNQEMKIYKKILLFLILATMLLLCELLFLSVTIPNSARTQGTLSTISRRIRRYVKLNNEIPHNLSNLPVLKGFMNEIEDSWGNDIIYEVNGTEVVLTSLGRDGEAGGA